ncbi:MAG TPA: hypothetical protein VFP70_09955 [Burkholderiales bacterium]|nr:hypothetical protein [Burkholderiales bacterium]
MERFLERYYGRMVIVHAGLSAGWVRELERERAARGVFRFDVRCRNRRRGSLMESVVLGQVLPRGLPLPLLMRVEHDGLRLRHLARGGRPVHPSELGPIFAELDRRYHLWLRVRGRHLAPLPGIPPADNRVFFET